VKYELHYWETDVTGSSKSNLSTLHIKPIYFPKQGLWGSWKYKLALGLEVIVDFDHADEGIGSGSDQIAPFVGVALAKGNTVLIPLVQHFASHNGPEVNTTAARLIGIQKLPKDYWTKLDIKIPVDWENDDEVPATGEVQLGKSFSPSFGAYVDLLAGIGGDRPYDWGAGIGARFNY
ncbi:MAG: hypothetical protein V3W18_07855, partial [candidate division Zixibacteria bacterium]